MSSLVEVVAAFFAVVLVASAVGKLDGWSTWNVFANRIADGAPVVVARVLSVVVPIVEFGAAAILLAAPRYGLEVTALLFICFAGLPAARYRRLKGERCACFGVVHQSEIGWALIVRNLALAACATAFGLASPTDAAVPVLAVCTAALGLMTAFAALRLRSNARIYAELFGTSLIVSLRGK